MALLYSTKKGDQLSALFHPCLCRPFAIDMLISMRNGNELSATYAKCIKCLMLVPIIYGLWQVANFGVNVVYWDEWEIIRLLNDIQCNGISLSKLLAQHNEHRIFFPRIALLLSGILTDYNVKVQMYISQCMMIAIYVVCLKVCKQYEGNELPFSNPMDAWMAVIIKLAIGFTCFSAIQCQNFLWGFQVGFIMVACMAGLSFFFFQRTVKTGSKKDLILCVVCGIVASFSSLQGLNVWPALIFTAALLVIYTEKKHLKSLLFILIFCIGSMYVYLHGFSFVEKHSGLRGANAGTIVGSFCAYIGGVGISSNVQISMLLGGLVVLISIVLFVYVVVAKKLEYNVFALNLIIFGYAAIAMIAIGRAGDEIHMPESRYLTSAIFPYIGIFLMAYGNILRKNGTIPLCIRRIAFTVLAGIIICVGITNFSALEMCKAEKNAKLERQEILTNYMSYPIRDLQKVYPWASYQNAYDIIKLLEKNTLNVFAVPDYSIRSVSNHILDNMNQVDFIGPVGFDINTIVLDGEFLYLNYPWAIDSVSGNEYQNVYVRVNGVLYKTRNHIERQDVADAFENANYKFSGFEFSLPESDLHTGENHMSILIVLNDGNSYYETAPVAFYYNSEISSILDGTNDWDNMQISGVMASYEVSEITESEDGISLVTEGSTDPQIVFNPMEKAVTPTAVTIEFSQIGTSGQMQLFYADVVEHFSEEKSITFDVSPEKTNYDLYGFLDSDVSAFRLDFVNLEGVAYQISSITVYYDG